jgi:hypothetical protein
MSDATIAISEAGMTTLLQRAIDGPLAAHGSGAWGPFIADYDVSLRISGGIVQFPDPSLPPGPVVRLSEVVVQGTVVGSIGLDLARVLPQLCIPPFQVCVPIDFWGDQVCTPQYCVTWPTISIQIPVIVPPIGVSLDFAILPPYQDGDVWRVDLGAYPFSLNFDLTPSINAILDKAKQVVHDILGQIPLIGDLIDGLVDTVINGLKAVINTILGAIHDFIEALIRLVDVFSPTIHFHAFKLSANQKILPAGGPGDREVDLIIAALAAQVTTDKELLLTTDFA